MFAQCFEISCSSIGHVLAKVLELRRTKALPDSYSDCNWPKVRTVNCHKLQTLFQWFVSGHNDMFPLSSSSCRCQVVYFVIVATVSPPCKVPSSARRFTTRLEFTTCWILNLMCLIFCWLDVESRGINSIYSSASRRRHKSYKHGA